MFADIRTNTVLLGHLTGNTTSLLHITFEHHFWTSLFGHHIRVSLLGVTYGCHFYTSLLVVTFGHVSWTAMLAKTVFIVKPL